MDLSFFDIFLALLVVAIGTAVQTSIGFGLAMVAAPALLLIDRQFVPAPLIVAALVLVSWMSWDERGAINKAHFKAALAGRLCGSPPAAFLIGTMSALAFDIVFGVLVLLGVLISLIHSNIRATPKTVFFATMASGFMSVISSIGGPPVALIYQNSKGPELRANLSALFVLGCIVSLISLAFVGRFSLMDFYRGTLLSIGVLIGVPLARPLQKHLDRQKARPYLLGLCAISALLVLIKAGLEMSEFYF